MDYQENRQVVTDEESNIIMPVPPLKIDAKNYRTIVVPFNITDHLEHIPTYEYNFEFIRLEETENLENDFDYLGSCYLIQCCCSITINTFPVDLGLEIYGNNINHHNQKHGAEQQGIHQKKNIEGMYMDESGGTKKRNFALVCHAKTTPQNQTIVRDKSHYFGKIFHKWGGVTKKDIMENITTLPGRRDMTVIKYPHVVIYFLHINCQEWLHAECLDEFVHMTNEETNEPDLYAFPTSVVERVQSFLFDLLKDFKPIDLSKIGIHLFPADNAQNFALSTCFLASLMDLDEHKLSSQHEENILKSRYQLAGHIEFTVLPQSRTNF